MNATNRAATALLIKKKWPGVPIVAVLLWVKLMGIFRAALVLLSVEATGTGPHVSVRNDIHFACMPYSHSIAATAVLALMECFVVPRLLNKATRGLALAVVTPSHIVVELATQVRDIALAPGINPPKFGSGLYRVPMLAFVRVILRGFRQPGVIGRQCNSFF